MPIFYSKPPLSYSKQVNKLLSNGLIITNHQQAENILSKVSYYRLSAYWYPFREMDENNQVQSMFKAGSKFDDALTLYEFDRKLRLLVIDAIERIEIAIRSRIAHEFANKYKDAFVHEKPNNFHHNFWHSQWLANAQAETERSNDVFINHYKEKYQGFPTVPLWMLTEVMSFGSLSKLYSGLLNDDKKLISGLFNIHHKQLTDWLHTLTYIRNICSHHGRLWNRELAITSQLPKQNEWHNPHVISNNRLYYALLIIRTLLKAFAQGQTWQQECTDLIKPISQNPDWQKAMGLPPNWDRHKLWI